MSDNKKYYYLKLKDNFFDSDAMIVLESMPDGYKYSNILLKLYLRSLKNEGKLMFNDRIPYNATILAQVTRHSVGDTRAAIELFKTLDLIEELDNGAIFMLDIQNFIGESSTEADRIRAYRARIKTDKMQLLANSTKERTNVTVDNDKRTYKSTPELELEIELKKEIKREKTNRNSAKAKYDDDSPYYKLAVRLFNHIKQRNPEHKEPNFQTWADEVRKAVELDKRTIQGLTDVLDWSQQNEFWQGNILSTKKLRDKYDTLKMQMPKEQFSSNQPQIYQHQVTDEDIAAYDKLKKEGFLNGKHKQNPRTI